MVSLYLAINFSQKVKFAFFVYLIIDYLALLIVQELAFEGDFLFVSRLKLKTL